MPESFTMQEDNEPLLRDNSEIPVNEEPEVVDEEDERTVDQYNFTTTEQAVADGAFKLDDKGRMPGIYLDELEKADRIRRGEMIQKAHDEAAINGTPLVEKQVNVSSSPLPPITVLEPQLVKEEAVSEPN